jgi:phosphoserine phosphatase
MVLITFPQSAAVAKLVIFDMDGVLADTESSWVHVHKHFGVNNDHSLRAYLRGEITDLEFIRRDIQLWREKEPDITERRISDILADVPLMPGANDALRGLRGAGCKTAIVSAGIEVLAKRIAKELNIDLYLANGFVTDRSGKLSGEGILKVRLMDKGDGVEMAAKALGIERGRIVSVGNSRYDVSMFRRSSKGIAFCPSDDIVREEADVVVDEKNLARILEHI